MDAIRVSRVMGCFNLARLRIAWWMEDPTDADRLRSSPLTNVGLMRVESPGAAVTLRRLGPRP